ncbi:Clan CA, family C1, cathepsin L-like cysteine peptidase [Tritrichomonas foetus]|uniref:Clan CA, family C1, cathepsin L-like cysteine peptidase n=1 Tax=Tritrichomonas foetus TaxID=1144522 RepID=A0A1J4KI45_9EUKA|nr:Clan CA, family C1, cathepsin L-like cysteine peptidase [Tritrichomonas foetus]|eukprot:OHT08997.1 Clan CA, family C1, cathepsin L-like cysteine peptidase [Tritrichomonas foetus]
MRSSNQYYTGDEYQFRLGIFLSNQRRVNEFNAAGHSFTVAMNKFAAYTPAEYKQLLGHKSTSSPSKKAATKTNAKPNKDSVDWRDSGIVNPIKDQGGCGSCWAFSVIQAMESQWAFVNKELPDLSEQNLVDCVVTCYGCGGGDEYLSYDYVLQFQNGLWMKQADYPYVGYDQSCRYDSAKGVCKFSSYYRPTESQDEDALAAACEKDGVVSVAIDASNWSFQLYSGGIYDEPSCNPTYLDHAVGLVGFGVEGSTKYWIVRNSWGTSWGEKGYVRMVRGKNNQCGVATDVIIPQI